MGKESGAEDSPEDALESAIGPGLKWLRFPGELEDRYEWQRSRARKIRLLTAVVVGQIVVNGFIYVNRAMVPDVVGDLLRFPFGRSGASPAMQARRPFKPS